MDVWVYIERKEEKRTIELLGFEPVSLVLKTGRLTRFVRVKCEDGDWI